MKRYIFTIMTLLIYYVLYNKEALTADLASQRKTNEIYNYNYILVQNNNDSNLPIIINADLATGYYPDNLTFTGNVHITQGDKHLQADKVHLRRSQFKDTTELIWIVDVFGNVCYEDNQIILKGLKGYINLDNKDINIWQGNYQMIGRQGHGKADLVRQCNKSRYIILDNGSFTSCLPNTNIWKIVGSKIIYDRKKQIIKIWNARFKLSSIPVFYSPYLQLPIGEKRRSGFLVPNTKYSTSNHLEFYLPYYWNIAPNIDATITPHYVHKYNKVIWENEFRYLTNFGIGIIEIDYLPFYNKVFKNNFQRKNKHHHWLLYWQHEGLLNRRWGFNVDYTKVSDYDYFDKFNSKYGSSNTVYTTQKINTTYMLNDFNATLSIKNFQILNHEFNSNYVTKPQLDINWYPNNTEPFDIHLYIQQAYFTNTNPNMPESMRLHLESTVNLPLTTNWISLNTEGKLMITYYNQKK